jgi:hypothetical protein
MKKNNKCDVGHISDMAYFLKKAKLMKNDTVSLRQLKSLIEAEIIFREHNNKTKILEKFGVQ